MKRIVFVFASLLIIPFQINAQWFVQASGVNNLLNSVVFFNADTGLIAAGYPATILKTIDGGTSWGSTSLGLSTNLEDMFFIDSHSGWVVGEEIFRTTDDGNTWNMQSSGTHNILLSVDFTNTNVGWALEAGGVVLKTTDAGTNWFIINDSLSYTGYFLDLDFTSELVGYAVSVNGIIMKTINGGLNWVQVYNNNALGFRRIVFSNNNDGWVVGYSGTILKTTDGGNSWDVQNSPTTENLWALSIIDQNLVFIVGMNGVVLNTSNGGQSWEQQISPSNINLLSVFFIDENTGWAVGDSGVIITTSNGGVIPVELTSFTVSVVDGKAELKWQTASELNNSGFEIQSASSLTSPPKREWEKIGFVSGKGTTNEINNYSFIDNNLLIQKTHYRLKQIDFDGTFSYSDEVEIDANAPIEFSLEQNYPNPFNPSTKISWQSPVGSWQTLKVYDILGNEVATLVNEYLEAGNYEVEFKSTVGSHQLANGVYFYKLQVGDFIETKKMILLK